MDEDITVMSHSQKQQQQQQQQQQQEQQQKKNTTIDDSHELQDIDLNVGAAFDNNSNNAQTVEITTNDDTVNDLNKNVMISKKNWVKFDDEMNATDESNKSITNDNNNNNNINKKRSNNSNIQNINSGTSKSNSTAGSPTTTSAATSTLPTAIADPNQLSPLTPTGLNVAAGGDTMPAVLTTESTHVTLTPTDKPYQKPEPSVVLSTNSPSIKGVINTQHKSNYINNNNTSNNNNNNDNRTTQKLHTKLSTTTTTTAPAAAASTKPSRIAETALDGVSNATKPVDTVLTMRNIELSTGGIQEGFANGDVIVTLFPVNTKWPWITPAIFRPELVPEELMAQGLTLTVEEYVNAIETLVNDYRFTVYNIFYKRILICWILFAFAVLLTFLFSGLQGVALFSLGVGWLFLNAAAIFVCMWVKLRLSRALEKCVARVNKQLIRHKILLVLDDRGHISCHKVSLCFLYFDAIPCINYLNEFLEHTEQNGGEAIRNDWEAKLDIDMNDIVIQGSTPTRVSRKQAVAQELFLSYLQRWGKDYVRRRLDWTVQDGGAHETPRHLQSSLCPCQYEEEVLRNKIKNYLKGRQCCGVQCINCWL